MLYIKQVLLIFGSKLTACISVMSFVFYFFLVQIDFELTNSLLVWEIFPLAVLNSSCWIYWAFEADILHSDVQIKFEVKLQLEKDTGWQECTN